MSLLSPSVSITRYRVQGRPTAPVLDTVATALNKYAIADIDNEATEKSVGWTSFQTPFAPNFEGSSYVLGPYLVFSLRIDRKQISPKVVNKHYRTEESRRLSESGRRFVTRDEKKMIREQILLSLSLRVPATPNIYDLVWNIEAGSLWFFSNLKAANEELETLFTRSFNVSLIRLFPYTSSELTTALSDAERDKLDRLVSTSFAD